MSLGGRFLSALTSFGAAERIPTDASTEEAGGAPVAVSVRQLLTVPRTSAKLFEASQVDRV